MCNPVVAVMAVSTVLSVAGTVQQASAYRAQGNYQNEIAQRNRRFADKQAADAIQRGVDAEAQFRLEASQFKSKQQAAIAASGFDVNFGSATDLLATTEALKETEALTIRENAEREAAGFQHQAEVASLQGQLAVLSGQSQSTATLLGGAGQVASSWYRYAAG